MQKIAFLSNTSIQTLERFLPDLHCTSYDINTIAQTLNGQVDSDFLLILLDINYYASDGYINHDSFNKFEELKSMIKVFRSNNAAKIIISNIAGNFIDLNASLNLEHHLQVLKLNEEIDKLNLLEDMTVLNMYQLTQNHGFFNFINLKNGFLFQAPWTKIALSAIASSVIEKITLFSQIRKKILFLDADNTLWGGIVGEDGVDNIDIDENYPGITYRLFQNQIKHLKDSGILLAMVSKNNKADIEEVFNKKNMPLKMNDFISTKINWKPKSQNIMEILDDLRLGSESAVLIDDSDFELSEVKSSLGIDVVKASVINPIDNISILEKLTSIKALNISLEDKNKSTQYIQEIHRKSNESKFTSIEGYLRDTGMEIKMSLNNLSQIKRITQLINKTNQFNSTSKRYNEAEILKMMNDYKIYSFSLKDKFGDLGIISIAILKESNIDLFLMSCRALGRTVENKILFLISKGLDTSLTASYMPNNKNVQVETFFEELCSEKKEVHGDSIIYYLPKLIEDVEYIKLAK